MVAQRQQPIVINAVVGEDHRLIVDLPPDFPLGEVTVTITWDQVEPVDYPSEDTWINAGILPPGTRPSEEILRELRDDD